MKDGKSTSLAPLFEDHVREAVQRVRNAIAEALADVGADTTRPLALSRRLGLDKNLVWKTCRLLRDEDSVAAIPRIPGKTGLKMLSKALSKAGAPASHIASIQAAIEEFEEMVDLHSGDRETLEMMLDDISVQGRPDRAEMHRKLLFRGASAIWGVRAAVQISTSFVAPGSDPLMCDLVWLSGLVDFRRLRRDAAWVMAAVRKAADDWTVMPVGQTHAIDPRHDRPNDAPLMEDYCSSPLPEIRVSTNRDGMTRYELVEGPVGNTAAATCILGHYGRNFVGRFREPNNRFGGHVVRLYTPAETLIHDLFVHCDLTHALDPQILLYSQMPGGCISGDGEDGRLPVHDPVIKLGGSPPHVITPEFPFYGRLLRDVFERMGWDAKDFRGFRFRMRYPPIPALAEWQYELAPNPCE